MLITLLMPAWVPGQLEPLGLHLDRVFNKYRCLDKRARGSLKRIRANGVNKQAATNRQLLVSVVDMYPAVSFS